MPVVAGQPDADLVKGEGGGETGLSRGTLMPAPSARSQHTHTHTHTHTLTKSYLDPPVGAPGGGRGGRRGGGDAGM